MQTSGATSLCMASERGHVKAVRALVDAGAAVNQVTVSADDGVMGMFACVRCECIVLVLWCCWGSSVL